LRKYEKEEKTFNFFCSIHETIFDETNFFY